MHNNAAALLLALLLRGGGSGGLVAGHELLACRRTKQTQHTHRGAARWMSKTSTHGVACEKRPRVRGTTRQPSGHRREADSNPTAPVLVQPATWPSGSGEDAHVQSRSSENPLVVNSPNRTLVRWKCCMYLPTMFSMHLDSDFSSALCEEEKGQHQDAAEPKSAPQPSAQWPERDSSHGTATACRHRRCSIVRFRTEHRSQC